MDHWLLTSSSSSSSSSETSDEEQEARIRRPRRILEHKNQMTDFDDVDFKTRFRLSKECVQEILGLIGDHLEPLSNRNRPISALNQLLIALRFYATGSFQLCTGDHFNVSKSSVCCIIKKVSHHIALLRPDFVKMPQNQNEEKIVKNKFHRISSVPRVLGAIDCTHIRLESPGGNLGELYRNRKGWFSINVQAVSDAKLKFMDIVAQWPGSVHDSTIFNDSMLRARFEANEYRDTYLLGDSGYACKTYLLTPLLNPQTPAEQAYNYAHIRTRNVVERAFGVLKRRFPCLSVGMRLHLNTTISVIVATVVLHNIAIDMADHAPNDNPNLEIPEYEYPMNNPHDYREYDNMAVRTALINTVFAR